MVRDSCVPLDPPHTAPVAPFTRKPPAVAKIVLEMIGSDLPAGWPEPPPGHVAAWHGVPSPPAPRAEKREGAAVSNR